jgi:hypothetical protein
MPRTIILLDCADEDKLNLATASAVMYAAEFLSDPKKPYEAVSFTVGDDWELRGSISQIERYTNLNRSQ